MVFATANGITLPIARNAWRLAPVYVGGDDERADDGTLLSAETARKREWEASLTPGSEFERERLRRLLEGHGLYVDFADGSYFSFAGLGPKAFGGTVAASGGPRTGKATISSGSLLEYGLAGTMRSRGAWTPTEGWTLMVFKKTSIADGGNGISYVDHIATGNVPVTRGTFANPAGVTQYRAGVLGNWSMGRWINVASDGDVGIHGYANDGSADAYDYAELLVLPFALPAAWAQQLTTFRAARAVAPLPRIALGGECIVDDAVDVRCRLVRAEGDQQMLDGVWVPSARRDDLTVREA